MMRIIYDCDNTMGLPFMEVDDGLTLLYLLGRPDVELLGVTTTFGNGTARQAHTQTIKLLQQAGQKDILVLEGADRRHAQPTKAARFLAETAAASPGEISLLATGPLGNLRGAVEIDPGFFGNLKQVACMGGYLSPLQIGKKRVAELNLSSDPEASYQVLNAACPVILMNAQTCLQARFDQRDITRLTTWPPKIRRVLTQWLMAFSIACGVQEFYLWDLLPAVYLSYPGLFSNEQVAVVSTAKDLENGQLILTDDVTRRRITMPSRIIDIECFKKILFEAWKEIKIE